MYARVHFSVRQARATSCTRLLMCTFHSAADARCLHPATRLHSACATADAAAWRRADWNI